MSDKFFFKGRQDARESHIKSGFQTNANRKLGTKKYPLELVVTSEERKKEIQDQVDEALIYAEIHVDSSEGAVELIAELTAQINKVETVKMEKTPTRNDPCSCGSGKKYKKCCG